MSKLYLNSISRRSTPISIDPKVYVGAIVPAKSGYLEPKLYTSVIELESELGEFKYDYMYKSLISSGIPVCLLPIITKESEFNKCSLRLTSESQIKYCYPKYQKTYKNKSRDSEIGKLEFIQSESQFYGLLLDFTDVDVNAFTAGSSGDDDLTSNYIIINTGVPDGTGNYWDQLISTDDDYNVSSSDYDYQDNPPIYIKKDINGEYLDISSTKYDYINNLKNIWNSQKYTQDTHSSCNSIEDLIKEYIHEFINSHGLPSKNLYSTELSILEWKNLLISESFKQDFYIETNKEVSRILSKLISVFPNDLKDIKDEYYIITEQNLINRLSYLQLSNDKLLFRFEYPSINLNHYSFPGLKITPITTYSQDMLCSYSEQTKLVEFYSKIKGDVGKSIKIKITSRYQDEDTYDIQITNGVIFESYVIRLFGTSTNNDTIHITDISKKSKLVDVVFYNYWYGSEIEDQVTDQYLIDDRYFNSINNIDYYQTNIRNTDELRLPLGEFNLDRSTDDPYDQDDIFNSLDIFRVSEWYPDLFLVSDLGNDKSYLDKLISSVDECEVGISADYKSASMYSQLLINLTPQHLNPEWTQRSDNGKYYKLSSKNNRQLYFYGKIHINELEYPAFYPYIFNLVEQRYLEYPAQDLMYDPFSLSVGGLILLYLDNQLIHSCEITHVQSIDDKYLLGLSVKHLTGTPLRLFGLLNQHTNTLKLVNGETLEEIDWRTYHVGDQGSYLKDLQINFLKYDNLNYFWEKIYEPLDQNSVFMLRYISSKYVRETYKQSSKFIGNTSNNIRQIANQINDKCRNYLKLVSSSDVTVLYSTQDFHLMKVTYEIEVEKLTNKTFKLDLILNI